MSHRRSTLTFAAVAALALPASLASARPAAPGPADLAPPEVSGVVLDAAREAADQRVGVRTRPDERGAQRGPQAGPAQPSDRELRRQLDAATEALVADGAVGVTARVEAPGFDWRGSAGSRELHRRPPAQPQDRFRVASITKTMIATLVMQEVQAGAFDVDTPVNDIVPGLFPDHDDVTVEHLLSHTSGAQTATDWLLLTRIEDPASWEDFFSAIGQDYSDAEHLAVVNALPWLFEPGTDFSYSNAGFVALGVLLQEVTGRELDDLLRDRVFRPAGMNHTSYPDDPGTNGPFLVGAADTGSPEEGGIGWVSLDFFDPDVFKAAGAAVSTTKDLNAFTEALVTGELLDPVHLADMLDPRADGGGLLPDYALGVYRIPDPCTGGWLYGHDGGSYGTLSIALTSTDGTRQLSLGATGRDLTAPLPAYDLNELLVPMLLSSC